MSNGMWFAFFGWWSLTLVAVYLLAWGRGFNKAAHDILGLPEEALKRFRDQYAKASK